jgi:hypothetical protein
MAEKLFSPAQANAALPLVRQIAGDVAQNHARIGDLTRAYEKKRHEPDPPQLELNETRLAIAAATGERDACIAELHDLGVQLKDAATGLVDFPGELDGEPVLWCWRLGEERVEYFHTAAEGFAGRRPIPVPVHA